MANTKTDVIDFLKHNRTLLQARNLYKNFPNKNLATDAYLATLPNTEKSVKIACYELCKIAGISERQMNALLNQPVKKKEVKKVIPLHTDTIEGAENVQEKNTEEIEKALLDFSEETPEETKQELIKFYKINFIPEFTPGAKGNKERKELAKELNLKVEGNKNIDFDTAFDKLLTDKLIALKNEAIEKRLKQLDIKTKESLKLIDQFPFLNNQDCPKELYLIVGDLMKAYRKFKETQPKLHEKATQEQMKQTVADVVASYIQRKEAFAELEYYKTNNTLLGEHPIFEQLKQEDEIKKLDTIELGKKLGNVINNINRNKAKQKESESEEDKAKYERFINRDKTLKKFIEKELKTRK